MAVIVSLKEVAKIALFCKFRFVGWLVRFANVCNVRGLPQLSRRAEAGGQKLIFSCTNLQSKSLYFLLVFSNFIIRFQCCISFFSLAANVSGLGVFAKYGTDYFLLNFKFLAKRKLEFTTKFAITPNRCCTT